MDPRSFLKAAQEITWLRTILLSLVLMAVGLAVIYATASAGAVWTEIAKSIAGSLVGAGAFTAAWEVFAKRSFARELRGEQLALQDLQSGLKTAGIVAIHPLEKVDWGKFFEPEGAYSLCFSYATTWRNNNRKHIADLAGRSRTTLTLFVPADNSPDLVATAEKFGMTPADLLKAIHDTIDDLKSHFNERITVRRLHHFPRYNVYLSPKSVMITLHQHKREKSAQVFVLEFDRSGSFGTWIQQDLEGAHVVTEPN